MNNGVKCHGKILMEGYRSFMSEEVNDIAIIDECDKVYYILREFEGVG